MSQPLQIASQSSIVGRSRPKPRPSSSVLWLQGITLAWMLIECGVSGFAAWTAHSPAILAFGVDSFVELLSAAVVLLQFAPSFSISEYKAARASAVLLFVLAFTVAADAPGLVQFAVAVHARIGGVEQQVQLARTGRVGDAIEYQATAQDPAVLVEPWTRAQALRLSDHEMEESARCEDRDLEHVIDGSHHDNPR